MSTETAPTSPAPTASSNGTTPAADLRPAPKGPTAAESLRKQREADKAAKANAQPKVNTTTGAALVEKAKAKRTDPRKSSTPTKAATVKKAPKAKPTPKAKAEPKAERKPKSGLRLMQIRALKVLVAPEYADGLPLETLSTKAGIGTAVMKRGLGAVARDCRAAHDEREGFKSLLTLGLVSVSEEEHQYKTDSPFLYAVTAKGREAYKKATDGDFKMPKKHKAPGEK